MLIKQILFLVVFFLTATGASADTLIRIMAANTSSGNFQAYEDPGIRIFQGLDPDIVLIQEFNYRSGSLRDLVDESFGPEFFFFEEPGNEQIPNGVISRWPIIESGEWIDNNVSNRDFAYARIDIPGPRHLWVVSVHFLTSSSGDRNSQASDLVADIRANVPEGDYLVVGGDFNVRSRGESAISTLRQVVTSDNTPVDQNGNDNTNAGRSRPYDWVMPDNDLNAFLTPVRIGSKSFPNGLVFDSRVYNPLSDVSPVQRGDSGVSGMQHMAVIKDFLVPDDGTATASPTPSPTPGPTSTPGTPTPTPRPGAGDVFINEIHYDDSSKGVNKDSNEGMEVAGPAGESASGWSLHLYNGSSSQLNVYDSATLSGSFPDQNGCFGAIWVDFEQVQNGSPDGVALVDPSGDVVQFLSYEGTFTAADGPAAGMTSEDIGVEETNGTAPGLSLQLTGTGSRYSDFTWQAEVPHTRGQPNQGQTFTGCAGTPTASPTPSPTAGPSPTPGTPTPTPTASPTASPSPTPFPTPQPGIGEVFINEIHYDDSSKDNAKDANEGVEIAGPAGESAAGWEIVLYNGSSSVLAPYDSATLSGNFPNQDGCFGTIWVAFTQVQNGGPDGIALVDPDGDVVQFLSYEGTFTAVEGPAAGMTSEDIGVAETNNTQPGLSLQLTGTGSRYSDFSWQSDVSHTRSQPNQGQTFSGCPATSTPSPTVSPSPTATPEPTVTPAIQRDGFVIY